MFGRSLNPNWWLSLLAIFIVSVTVRVHQIHVPNAICWDEFHFTKMSTSYINGNFFFDVHPPLGKILLSLVGYLNNYKGSLDQKIVGEPYKVEYPYIELRMFCGVISSLVPIICFWTVWTSTNSIRASFLSAAFMTFDNSLILIGRLILLDSMLIFFMIISFSCFIKFQRCKIFSISKVFWLILTGISLGLEISIKLIGIFTLCFYLYCSVSEIWSILPNKSFKISHIAKLCGLYVLCLVLVPFIVYSGIFVLHFELLKNSGSGDYLFSPSFQSHLNGNMFNDIDIPKYVAYDSNIVLKNVGIKKYLNHPSQPDCHRLDGMVTTFPIITGEAYWKFRPFLHKENELRYVLGADVVLLKHSMSSRSLLTLSSSSHENLDISCAEEVDEKEENHFYKIKIVSNLFPEAIFVNNYIDESEVLPNRNIILQPLKHVFHLEDINNDCFLQATEIPSAIAGHKLVTCNPTLPNENSLWYIEWITDERVVRSKVHMHPLTFWQKFVETHKVMFKVNSELEAGKSDSNSFPWQWIFNIPGQPILGPEYVIYLLGTPMIWWMSFVVLLMSIIMMAIVIMSKRRGHSLLTTELQHLMERNLWMVIAWFLHYFPFYLMSRPLYFHHYLPAAVFKFMVSGVSIHLFMRIAEYYVHPLVTSSAAVALIATIFNNFRVFSILTYGVNMTQECSEKILDGLKWTNKWNF